MSQINWLKLQTWDYQFGGLRWRVVNNFKNNYSQLELITWMWKQRCERTMWPHERLEAHFAPIDFFSTTKIKWIDLK